MGFWNHILPISNNYEYSYRVFQVFSDKEEAALFKYIITMSKLFHKLSKMQTKQLAYKFAKNINIKIS